MGRWMKPEVSNWDTHSITIGYDGDSNFLYSSITFKNDKVYPLLAAMTFVTSMCVFQLSRNLARNPDVRLSKARRSMAVLENKEEGEKYAEHGLRKFLRTRPPEIMPTINHFFSQDK